MKLGKKKVSEFQRQQMSDISSDQIKKDNSKLIARCLNVPVGGRRPSFLCGGGADDGSSPSQLLDLEEVLSCGRRPKEMVATSHRTSALEPAGGCLRSRLRARWRDLHLHPCPEPASSPAPKPTGAHLHPRPRARRRPPPRQRLRREEEMDAVREGGEARDLGRAGGSAMVTDSVEDGACGAEGEEKSRWGQSHGRVKPRLLRTEFCSPFHSF
jgi:hypothetical protein